MPTWLVVALSIIYFFWSLLEIGGLVAVLTIPSARYTASAGRKLLVWLGSLVGLVCYLVSLLF
jgi:hypothetical protein